MSAATSVVAIRVAVPADEPRLIAIDDATWSPRVTPAPRAERPVFFRPDVEPRDTLVAEVDGVLAGYALVGTATPLPASTRVQMLRGIAVDPAFHGRGIGLALVEAAVAEARARGAVKIRLRVLSTNEVALRLYERTGFEVEGVLRDEFVLDGQSVDDMLLARRLDA